MSAKTNKRKNCAYAHVDLLNALEETRNETLTAWKAAKKYKIPYATLKRKIAGKNSGKYGKDTILCAHDEEMLANWIKRRARMGLPIEKKELLEAAVKIAEKRGGKTFTDKGWCFLMTLRDISIGLWLS
jgi:hypothetical protein